MRTSTNLEQIGVNEKFDGLNITESSDAAIRAGVQKDVIKRILQGEVIPDLKTELDSCLIAKNYIWENQTQRQVNLAYWDRRIKSFTDYFKTVCDRCPVTFFNHNDDLIVSYFGEDIKVLADFGWLDENNVYHIARLHTGKYNPTYFKKTETYSLGLLGEKYSRIFVPDINPTVQIHEYYLSENTEAAERSNCLKPYEERELSYDNIMSPSLRSEALIEDDKAKDKGGCNPENCGDCAMNNICNYTEAPIAIPVEKSVKPLSDIHPTLAQQRIRDFENGTARVNAGAGAGKTLVVALRIVELMRNGVAPEDICLLTFTRTGAEEMTARVTQYLSENGILLDPDKLVSTTFNSFCQLIINKHYEELGYNRIPRIIPDSVRYGIINRILDELPPIADWKRSNFKSKSKNKAFMKQARTALEECSDVFYEIKKNGYTRDNHKLVFKDEDLDKIFLAYDRYEEELKLRSAIEFDDQMNLVNELFEMNPDLFKEFGAPDANGNTNGFKHIIVDEFQDTNLREVDLLHKLCDVNAHRSLMCVGDDCQSIFAFRGTTPEYMINFGNYFGDFTDFELIENHRSSANIINLGNKINDDTHVKVFKNLIATKEAGLPVQAVPFYTKKQELETIASRIKEDIDAGTIPSDIAYLASNKFELQEMADALTKLGIPSIMMNPIPFKENSRVKALCSFYDSYLHGTNKGAMEYQNVLYNGIFKGLNSDEIKSITDDFLAELFSKEVSLNSFKKYANALDENCVDEAYQEFLKNLDYVESLEELTEFFHDFDLYGDKSCYKREGKYEGVCLTTVHSSKGLEWEKIYLTLSKLDTPSLHKRWSAANDEANRRLFVGITRAKQQLVISGQYVVQKNKSGTILNDYLASVMDKLDIPYNFNEQLYDYTKAEELAKEKRDAVEAMLRRNGITGERAEQILSTSSNIQDADYMLRRQRLQREGLIEPDPEPVPEEPIQVIEERE